MAAYDHNAALFFDAEGRFVKACGHCRQPRSAEDVTTHDGSASGACDCTIAWELYTRPAAAMHGHSTPVIAQGTDADAQPEAAPTAEAQGAGDGDGDGGEPQVSALAAMHGHSTPAAAQGTDADAQPEAQEAGDGDCGEPQVSALAATMHDHSTDADAQPEAAPTAQAEAREAGDGDCGEPQESALDAMQGHSTPAAAHSIDADAQPEATPTAEAREAGDGDGDGGEPEVSAPAATMHDHSTDADAQPEATPTAEAREAGDGDGDGGEPEVSAPAATMHDHSTDADAQPEAAPPTQTEAQEAGDGDGDGGEPDAGAHDPGPGEILRLERLAESLATADYRNYIMVAGADAHGRAVRAVACDADSVHEPGSPRYVGWRKMEVYELAGVTGQAEANALAAELLAQLSPSPQHVALITPLEAGLRVGQVLRIHGGERAGVSGAIYRIVRVEHCVQRAPHRLAYSSIQARAVPE
jgi:hypothetical protein